MINDYQTIIYQLTVLLVRNEVIIMTPNSFSGGSNKPEKLIFFYTCDDMNYSEKYSIRSIFIINDQIEILVCSGNIYPVIDIPYKNLPIHFIWSSRFGFYFL